MSDFFKDIKPLSYDPDGSGLGFRHYNPDEVFMGKRMEDHLRFGIAYWHSIPLAGKLLTARGLVRRWIWPA